MIDRVPPQNLEVEKSVLGAMLLDNDCIDGVAELVRPEDFYRDAHVLMAEAIFDLRSGDSPANPLTVAEELDRRGTLRRVGGEDYLLDCLNAVPHAVSARYHAGILRDKAAVRRLLAVHEQGITDIYANSHTVHQLYDRLSGALADAVEAGRIRDEVQPINEALDAALEVMDARRRGSTVGVTSGLLALDDKIGSFDHGSFTVIGARPGAGKTALALNIAENAVRVQGVPTLFFSMEMARHELGARLLSARGNVDGYVFKRPDRLEDDRFESVVGKLGRAYEELRGLPLYVDDTCGRTSMQIVSIARRARTRHGIGLVIVDYLQLCEADDERDTRQEQVSKISRRLKVLARSLQIPVIALSQLNRECENRPDRRPRKSDLRESGSLEQDADNVLLLYTPDEQASEAEIIVDKSRNGPTGSVEVTFNRRVTRFEPRVPLGIGTPPF